MQKVLSQNHIYKYRCAHGFFILTVFSILTEIHILVLQRAGRLEWVTILLLVAYKTLQLRATARDRRGGLPVAIAGTSTGSSAIIMRDMSLW